MDADGLGEKDVVHRMNEGYGVWAAIKSLLSELSLSVHEFPISYSHTEWYLLFLTVQVQVHTANSVRDGHVLQH